MKLINVFDAYTGFEIVINVAQIAEAQAVYGRQHSAAIRLIGRDDWIRVRESIEQIGRLAADAEEL